MSKNETTKFDLEERTSRFGIESIIFGKTISKNVITVPLINQFIRSSTSVGANYCEANNAQTRADFKYKVYICKKESKETVHWLNLIIVADPAVRDKAEILLQEARELNLIFSAIVRKTEVNNKISQINNLNLVSN